MTPVLAPGMIDLQVNGIGAVDLVDADRHGWAEVGRTLLAHGVTGYCPTFVSATLDTYRPALERAAAAQHAAVRAGDQAAILGIHLEGPFLGAAPGAHAVEMLRPADVGWLEARLDDHPGLIRLVTLSPEADPRLEATRFLADAGVVVALGHSRASYEQTMAAVEAGASVVTHLFNGMGALRARDPGLIGTALTEPGVASTVIADLVHVHAAALRLAFGATVGLAIVSDSVACIAGISARDGAARLSDGTLAGATVLLDGALRNLVQIGIDHELAVQAVTTRPASILGIELPVGDRVALDRETLEVRAVWLGGEQVVGQERSGQ